LPQAAGNGLVGYIDARDIAQVAFCVLNEDHHKRATYYLNGPEVLDMKECALRLSNSLNKNVRYINLPAFAFRILLRAFGTSRWVTNGLIQQYAEVVAKHHDNDMNEEFVRLTKLQPRSFTDFVNDNKKSFTDHNK
jgi:uncharacterized protein YbjT (DUF2867 family)